MCRVNKSWVVGGGFVNLLLPIYSAMASSVKCLSFSVAILFVGAVCGLKCYFCDSSSGDLCDQNKNFTALPLENCPAEVPSWFGEIYCARMTVKGFVVNLRI